MPTEIGGADGVGVYGKEFNIVCTTKIASGDANGNADGTVIRARVVARVSAINTTCRSPKANRAHCGARGSRYIAYERRSLRGVINAFTTSSVTAALAAWWRATIGLSTLMSSALISPEAMDPDE